LAICVGAAMLGLEQTKALGGFIQYPGTVQAAIERDHTIGCHRSLITRQWGGQKLIA
jgi:hypothetical protein